MAISIEIDKSFSDELDEMINEIELNIQKTMSVEELEKYKKYPFLAISKSQIIESLIDEIELSPSLKQKIINAELICEWELKSSNIVDEKLIKSYKQFLK